MGRLKLEDSIFNIFFRQDNDVIVNNDIIEWMNQIHFKFSYFNDTFFFSSSCLMTILRYIEYNIVLHILLLTAIYIYLLLKK